MEKNLLTILLLSTIIEFCHNSEDIKWCVINEAEMAKCNQLQMALTINQNITQQFNFTCFLGKDVFDCMDKINKLKADVMNLDVGLAYYAVQNYGMRAMAVENYGSGADQVALNLTYTANAVVQKGTVATPVNLRNISACFAGTGTAEGWIYPISRMIKEKWMRVYECSNEVQTATAFFTNGSCASGSSFPIFNALGDNGDSSCKRCASQSDSRRYCSSSDPYSGNAGAIKCLDNERVAGRVSVAFVRGDIIQRMVANNDLDPSRYELLCPDKQADGTYVAPLTQTNTCLWGRPQSRMIMTQLTSIRIPIYQKFLEMVVTLFGTNGTSKDQFKMFDSRGPYNLTQSLLLILGQSGNLNVPQPLYDLMFSDLTTGIYFPPESQIINYFQYTDADFRGAIKIIQNCPIPGIKWCVISDDELEKCSKMKLALDSRRLRPEFFCVHGGSTTNCMRLINQGFADLMTLDAAEVYIGGKYLNLVPIATEFYGDDSNYYGVAIAKRADKGILISNWKYKRTCHSGAGKASGWVIPLNIALETVQMRVRDNQLVYGFSELIARSCVPGILEASYNVLTKNPINLCEICASEGHDRCQPDTREQYYGDSGAFRCMLENGDIAFARHTTVHDNTDGRNPVDWARSRRSDDYELLCPDGSRVDTYSWRHCNLGKIPGNMIVTGHFKTPYQRNNMWRLLRYAQEYYSSDSNDVFAMFSSPYGRSDLMFSDAAVSLRPIPDDDQHYTKALDRSFARQVENLELIGNVRFSGLFNPNSAPTTTTVAATSSLLLMTALSSWLISST